MFDIDDILKNKDLDIIESMESGIKNAYKNNVHNSDMTWFWFGYLSGFLVAFFRNGIISKSEMKCLADINLEFAKLSFVKFESN
jgi:hypothetical protein